MTRRFNVAAAVFAFVLSTVLLAPPAFSMQREGPGRDNPIIRVIKQLLHKLGGVAPDSDDLAPPHP